MEAIEEKKDWKHGGYLVHAVNLDAGIWVNMSRARTHAAFFFGLSPGEVELRSMHKSD